MNLIQLTVRLIIVLLASASLTVAQNTNQQAVDTLTKDVAKAVFGSLQLLPNNLKAAQIYNRLASCGDGCDPTTIIQTVGGYDAVGMKMQELSELKNTVSFSAMSPEEANAAIRKQLALFYAKYKADKNYGKPLNPAVQTQILAKIDAIIPPAEPEPSSTAVTTPAALGTDAETGTEPEALQSSQSEPRSKEVEANPLWMMIASALVGLVLGAGAIYLIFYRAALAELKVLLDENNQLRNSLETAQRAKPGSAENVNSVRVDYRQKATAYDAILAELSTDNPLLAIRQLKQQKTAGTTPQSVPVARAVEPPIAPEKPAPVNVQAAPVQPVPVQVPSPPPSRSEVFYFPPPDPTGLFDNQQKTAALSPESAYRFSINDGNSPSIASFRFEAEPGRLARFLTYRNYMIEPACESENSYVPAHTRITMRRDGEAVLENGGWRVKTKALIRYE